jgi:hypothetical protein
MFSARSSSGGNAYDAVASSFEARATDAQRRAQALQQRATSLSGAASIVEVLTSDVDGWGDQRELAGENYALLGRLERDHARSREITSS